MILSILLLCYAFRLVRQHIHFFISYLSCLAIVRNIQLTDDAVDPDGSNQNLAMGGAPASVNLDSIELRSREDDRWFMIGLLQGRSECFERAPRHSWEWPPRCWVFVSCQICGRDTGHLIVAVLYYLHLKLMLLLMLLLFLHFNVQQMPFLSLLWAS